MKKPRKRENCPICGKIMNLTTEKQLYHNLACDSYDYRSRQYYKCQAEKPYPHSTIVYIRKSK